MNANQSFDLEHPETKFLFATPVHSDRKRFYPKKYFEGELSFDKKSPRSPNSSAKLAEELVEEEDETPGPLPEGKIYCTCGKSKCLKLYCHCFKLGNYCTSECQCTVCKNKPQFSADRQMAIQMIKTRNPLAFTPIIDSASQVHYKGCNCKKSHCQQKYCECYQMNVQCTDQCKCVSCRNGKKEQKREDSKQRWPREVIEDSAEGLRKRLHLSKESHHHIKESLPNMYKEHMLSHGKSPKSNIKSRDTSKNKPSGKKSTDAVKGSTGPGKKDPRKQRD
jgi:hypothetical protein